MTVERKAPSDVAIITVSYNSSALLYNFLKNAINAVSSPSNIFVVDNASQDLYSSIAISEKFGTKTIPLSQNKGYGGAVNEASKYLDSSIRYIVVSNPDCTLSEHTIWVLREKLENNKSLGIVGPKILNADGTIYPSGREFPSIGTGIGHAIFGNVWPSNPWTKKYHSAAYLKDEDSVVGWVSGSSFMIKRHLFNKLNGFNESYFMYMEDVDLAFRASKIGLTTLYTPDAEVTHLGGESTKHVKNKMLKVHHESAMQFIDSRYSAKYWIPVKFVIRLGLRLRIWFQTKNMNEH